MEALVRWRHPRLGTILPAGFIPVNGQSCLMRDVTAGIRSVAEGVESADVAGALATMGCDAAQGRYHCGPLDPAAATGWLADHLRPAAAARAGAAGR